jgi:hypothetical protein
MLWKISGSKGARDLHPLVHLFIAVVPKFPQSSKVIRGHPRPDFFKVVAVYRDETCALCDGEKITLNNDKHLANGFVRHCYLG